MRRNGSMPEEDDGRTIADMNVEGMPWYSRERKQNPSPGIRGEELGPKERRALLTGVLGAAMVVALVFGGAYFLVILLMDLLLP